MPEKKFESENDEHNYDFLIDFEQVEEVSRVFFEESKEILEELDGLILRLEQNPEDQDQLNQLFRKIHTIKGSVGAVPGGQLLGSLAHEFEALLTRIKREGHAVSKECVDLWLKSSRILKVLAQSLRDKRDLYPEELSEAIELISSYGNFEFPDGEGATVTRVQRTSLPTSSGDEEAGVWLSMTQLNDFLRISGELLVLKNFFQTINQTVDFREHPDVFQRRQADFSQNLTKICDQFQKQVQTVRKETVNETFQGLHVVVRQASMELNKTVQFEISGGDIQIDKGLGKDLYEALVHVARNSVDHGIEDQFERTLQGKVPSGTLTLDVSEKNNTVFVTFKDDGQGMNKEKILQRALKVGLVTPDQVPLLSDDEIYRLIFNAGFSTKEKVTTISGRGVGMDIVLSTVEKYQGKIRIENTEGQGLALYLEIPVPQFIMVETALLVTWQGFQFAVPLASVAHMSSCGDVKITEVDGLRFCQYSGQTVPLLNYAEMAQMRISESLEKVRASSAVYIRVQDLTLALLVDKVEAQTDLVVKSFGRVIGEQKGFKGVSILADEKMTYILDPDQLRSLLVSDSVREAA